MRRYLLLLLTICTLSLFAVVALQPDAALRTEAELARLTPEDALKKLSAEGFYTTEDRNIALEHARLSLQAGEIDTSIKLYTRLSEALPGDPWIHDNLARAYELSGKSSFAAQELQTAYKLEQTEERRQKLAGLYRVQGNTTEEIAILTSVSPKNLTEWEAERLSRLLMKAGRDDELEDFYRKIAPSQSPFAEKAKDFLIIFLIDEGRSPEALQAALDWYINSKLDPDLISRLLKVLINRGAIAEAEWLARQSFDASPETGHLLVQIFVRTGHRLIAGKFEDEVLAKPGVLSLKEWQSLIDFAALTGDLHGLQTALAKHQNKVIETQILSQVLLQFLRYRGSLALAPYSDLVTEELIREAPLIAAAFAVEHRLFDDVVMHLAAASREQLNAWDKTIWLSLASRLYNTGYYNNLASPGVVSVEFNEALRSEYANDMN